MSRRGNGTSQNGGGPGPTGGGPASGPTRERQISAGRSVEGSPSSHDSASSRESHGASGATTNANAQFVSIRSRVGKRYQATLPELREKPVAPEMLQVMHLSKPRYSLDRANALGSDLEKYLKLARALRDGSTFDTDEQITCLALQYLHRFDYNTTDAACSLYARHSMEVPKLAAPGVEQSTTRANNPADIEAQWIATFYQMMRLPRISIDVYNKMAQLLVKAASSGIAATELGVLERQVNRLTKWLTVVDDIKDRLVERAELEDLVYQAEDLMFDHPHKGDLANRLREFDLAYGRLKDAFDRSNRRNQSKCELDELDVLHAAAAQVQVNYPEKEEYTAILEDARQLKGTIVTMLGEEKVNLTAMRDVIARIELVPVNFEKQVDQFQQKMLSAQSWLAKVRKCIPKRRASRRGGPEPKKMDLQAIRSLVDDAPCEDSAEIYEMQDLLECADEWAEKVKEAIEGGADVTLEELKELRDEGNAMPVDMEEQKFLDAEISAREWCTSAASMLTTKKPFQDLEDTVEEAKAIRKQLHAKKQSRWKPQIERDIQSALDTARRWLNEIRDVVGQPAFDKIFTSSSAQVLSTSFDYFAVLEATAKANNRLDAMAAFTKGKKPVDAVHKLLEKAERLTVNVDIYTSRLTEILELASLAQQEARELLVKIGVLEAHPRLEAPVANQEQKEDRDEPMPLAASVQAEGLFSSAKNGGDFAHASAVMEKIAGLPVVFDEGIKLFEIIHAEKEWAERVRTAIPPRQSRKKSQLKEETTLDGLRALQEESSHLRFQFPEEAKILSRELEDIAVWQQKAIEVVAERATTMIGTVAMNLKKHDFLVFSKFTEAKKLLIIGDGEGNSFTDAHPHENCIDMKAFIDETGNSTTEQDNGVVCLKSSEEPVPTSTTDHVSSLDDTAFESPEGKLDSSSVVGSPGTFVAELFRVDQIIDTIRREAGCPKKAPEGGADDDSSDQHKQSARSFSVLDPLLTLVEESIAAVNAVETKDDKKKFDELLLVSSPQQDIFGPDGSADEAVRQLEQWRDQISQTLDEGNLFNAFAPEQNGLAVVLELLEWLQSARSIFYNEALPIKDLVTKGKQLQERIGAMRAKFTTFDDFTTGLLAQMLWPLPYLVMHDRVVQSWVGRVAKSMEDKHAPIEEVQKLLSEASSLLLEPDSIKIILDELKKAKLWLAKLKKRLKALMTKQLNRLTMPIAKALVEEGEDIAIELPAFDTLKEHVDQAVDWERRVLASGLENGQARIATLVNLLDEYDRARLVIDLDMHRDVLKSATERYCVCRQPYDGFMIGCDYCDDWFHDNCIGMSKEKAEKVENYTCPSCSILLELKSGLLRAVECQPTLWTDNDYGKSYEKQHAATLRKIKREEKAVERSEMLLFSCNNHMNQLRARIDDIERAKSCFTTLKNPFEAAASALPAPSGVVENKALVAASSATSQTPSGSLSLSLSVTLPLSASTASMTAKSTSSPAIPNVPMDTLAFVQRYPNILLPSAKFGVGQSDADKKLSPVQGATPAAPAPAPASSPADTSHQSSVSSEAVQQLRVSDTKPPAASPPTAMPDMMPSMLAPMLAKLSENRERLSALLVAGGVEQQLAKMKTEHAEVKAQVDELQLMIRVGKERLAATQATLDELKRAYVIRQHGLPRAKSWIHRIIHLINSPTSLLRQKFVPPSSTSSFPDELCFLSAEFMEVLTDAKAKEIAHFPEVKIYETLLRAVGWALVTTSLLQERPSRETLMVAIVYANEHLLIDPAKAVAPLRSIIGRVDVWIMKAHKTLGKQVSQSQKAARLKGLMNEYTKLPLTCSWVHTLEKYLHSLEEPDKRLSAEQSLRIQTELEAAAVGAVFSASTTWLPAPHVKLPRKRKPYAKRDKSGAHADGDASEFKKAGKKAKTDKQASKPSGPPAIEPEEEVDPLPTNEGETEDFEMADADVAEVSSRPAQATEEHEP